MYTMLKGLPSTYPNNNNNNNNNEVKDTDSLINIDNIMAILLNTNVTKLGQINYYKY